MPTHPQLLPPERLAEMAGFVTEERTNSDNIPVTRLGFWPGVVDELLAHADAQREQLRLVLEGLLDKVPSPDGPADLEWHRIRFHNERIHAAAQSVGIDLTK